MEALICEDRQKSVRRIRREGKVPGVLYGSQIGNLLFQVGEIELNKEISQYGEHAALDVQINNKKCKALIKEVQREPITHKIIHIDLQEVTKDEIIEKEVSLVLEGEDLITKNGGIVQKEKSSVKIQGKYNDIPKAINIDLSKLKIGDVIKISDLKASDKMTFVEDLDTVLISITNVKEAPVSEEVSVDSEDIPKEVE